MTPGWLRALSVLAMALLAVLLLLGYVEALTWVAGRWAA